VEAAPIRLSNAKVKTWRRCPNKYRYKYVMNLQPKTRGIALERGSWIHELLMVHYDGEDWRVRHDLLSKQFYSLFEEEREMLGDLPDECARIMRSYLRHWREADRHFRVVDSEVNEIVTLPSGIEFNVVVDLIVEDEDGFLWPWDHKTRKNFAEADDMVLDPQLTNYFTSLEIMGYHPLGGAVYNEIRTKPPTIPKVLKTGGLSRKKRIDTDAYTYMREVKRRGLNPANYRSIILHLRDSKKDAFFKRTMLPKDPPMLKQMRRELTWTANEILRAERKGEYPRTFIPRQCKWDCEYKDPCIVELHGGDVESILKHDFERRSKYGE
jgi:PD-(D/E)XK nuclease superfamily